MTTRYAIVGSWSTEETVTAEDMSWGGDSTRYSVITETATLRDTRSGTEYREGAYRVRVVPTLAGHRGKTFRGETAWSDAARYAGDIVTAIRFGREG